MKKLVLLLCVAVYAAAAPELPDTPAGRVFGLWLKAFNTGSKDKFGQFLKAYSPGRLPVLDEDMEFRAATGGFDLTKIEASAVTSIKGIVKERGGTNYARFEVTVEAKEPHRISRFSLLVTDPPPPDVRSETKRLSEQEAIAAWRAELETQAASDRFSGSVVVVHDGKPVFSGAYGLADRSRKIPNQLDTRFRIGSMNKMFTAASILQLVQAGKLRPNDPIAKYLTDYPNQDLAKRVTVHHLLTHTGGTGDIFGPQFTRHRLELRSLSDYVALYGKRATEFEPGSKHVYSNYGFLLLGVLIERITGESYYDYVREHVFKPAGMSHTGSLPESVSVAGRSIGYMNGPNWTPNTDTLPYRGTSAGGGYSTAGDLVRFAQALLSHKLLGAEYTALLTAGKVDVFPGMRYAYGFMDVRRGGSHWFGHGGGAPGMNGELRIYPESGYICAVLANLDPPAASRIADFIGERFPQ
jgi:D-alanyl-D-alanine carboxypeptidase